MLSKRLCTAFIASLIFAAAVCDLTALADDSLPRITPLPVGNMQDRDPMIYYDSLISLHSDDYAVLYRRGKHQEELQHYTGALKDFRLSLEHNPLKSDKYTSKTNNVARTLRAWAFQDIGYIYCMQNKFANAIECFTHAISLRPNYADNFQNRGSAYAKLGKRDLARKDFAEAQLLRRTASLDDCTEAPFTIYKDSQPAKLRAMLERLKKPQMPKRSAKSAD